VDKFKTGTGLERLDGLLIFRTKQGISQKWCLRNMFLLMTRK